MKEFKKFNGTDWQTIQPKKYDLKEISGTPPFSFESDGRVLQDWSITGQTVQDGTPTPENPIMPSGCGERTENLFDKDATLDGYWLSSATGNAVSQAGYSVSDYIRASDGESYTLVEAGRTFCWYDENKRFISTTVSTTASAPTGAAYFRVNLYTANKRIAMVIEGSTAPSSYIPYGYKLPLSSAGQNVDIYLGEVETTRRIKKLVLTGEEKWASAYDGDNMFFYMSLSGAYNVNSFMSHFVRTAIGSQTTAIGYLILNSGEFRVRPNNPSTMILKGFKSYLAAQHAAGTPVTVWYVLAEPETGIVNEPLMKIGDYADEINLTNSGVNIPTIEGSNTLTVNTTIQPSSMNIKKGLWKDCPLYEYTPYISGVPPFIFKSDGQNLRDWNMIGQTVQNGTPTPENPIMPSGCGERTKNLCKISADNSVSYSTYTQYSIADDTVYTTGNTLVAFICKVAPNTQYTVSTTATMGSSLRIREYSDYPDNWGSGFVTQSLSVACSIISPTSGTIITNANTQYIGVTLFTINRGKFTDTMLNLGSTALPYEPYGYKLPILSNSTVTNIYLGEVETTRKIKKLVLTGKETWSYDSINTRFASFMQGMDYKGARETTFICSHYEVIDDGRIITDVPNNAAYAGGTVARPLCYIKTDEYSNEDDFKSYLAAQYAAGTPVTVWYVLAKPEKAVVNEPLMKIGNYADEISKTGTSMDIPTVLGSNTLTVSTAVQPSEMTIESISQWIKQN